MGGRLTFAHGRRQEMGTSGAGAFMNSPDPANRHMQPSLLNTLGKGGAFLFLGVLVGTFVFFVTLLQLRYALPVLAALLLPVLVILSGHGKAMLQGLLVLSTAIFVRKTLAFVSPDHTGGPVGLDVLLIDYILFLLYVLWIYEGFFLKKPGEGITVPRIAWLWLAFIVVSILSASRAIEVRYSIFEIFRQIKVFLFFLYVVNHFGSSRAIRMALGILAGVVITHALVTFLQRFTGQGLYLPFLMYPPAQDPDTIRLLDMYLRRPGGLFGNANSAACYLSILLPTLFATLFWEMKRSMKIFFGLACFLGAAALVDSYSRAGWLTIPPAVALFAFLGIRRRLFSLRRHTPVLLASAMFALCLILFYAKPIHLRLTAPTDKSAYSRIYLMQVSVKMILQQPLLGYGVNNWNLAFIPFHHEIYDPHDSLLKGKKIYYVVHNVYFLIAVDTGLVGLLLFFWILFEMGKNAWRGSRAADPMVASLSIGLLTSLVSFSIVEFFDFSYVQYESILFMFWVLIALSVIVGKHAKEATKHPTDTSLR